MKRYTHLVWDFNGTILNDVAYDLGVTNRLLERHGLPKLPDENAYRNIFGFPVIDYYQRLGFDFSKTPFSVLADEWMNDYNERKETAPIHCGVAERLRAVRAAGIPQILLSATKTEMLLEQLNALGVTELFDEIIGADNHHAYGKAALAREWKRKNPLAVPLMIGDTDHDAESAEAMGGDILLLTCGHQARKTLEAVHPLAIYESVAEIPLELYFPALSSGND